ncbi:DUF6629 family protein [Streptomyces sp. NPDC060031]|uniref:DUF6629 family protein n=1 Tax=Streptomyces sp. NPDC060031 TaxID=3347043 RepID=UPI0036BBD6BD
MDTAGSCGLPARRSRRAADLRRPAPPGARWVPAAGALACSAMWRLEFASTRCAFAAADALLVPGWTRHPEPASPVS